MPNVVSTLSQCWVWLGQIQHCYNITTTLMVSITSQRCHNVGKLYNFTILPQRWYIIANNYISQHSHDVQATLCECCVNIGVHCWNLIKLQCSGNVVWTLVPNVEIWPNFCVIFNIATALWQCCLNVVWTWLADWSTTFPQRLTTVAKLHYFQCCHNFGTTLQEHTKNQKLDFPFQN